MILTSLTVKQTSHHEGDKPCTWAGTCIFGSTHNLLNRWVWITQRGFLGCDSRWRPCSQYTFTSLKLQSQQLCKNRNRWQSSCSEVMAKLSLQLYYELDDLLGFTCCRPTLAQKSLFRGLGRQIAAWRECMKGFCS